MVIRLHYFKTQINLKLFKKKSESKRVMQINN